MRPNEHADAQRLPNDFPHGRDVSAGSGLGKCVWRGQANYAEWQVVSVLLCAPVPDNVTAQDAAITAIASIVMHGLRLVEVGPGSRPW